MLYSTHKILQDELKVSPQKVKTIKPLQLPPSECKVCHAKTKTDKTNIVVPLNATIPQYFTRHYIIIHTE